MASSDLGDLGTSNRITGADLESVAANASAERALDGMRATAATQDRPQPPITDRAAFFDVDNTLVQGSSAVHFGRGWRRHYFTYRDVLASSMRRPSSSCSAWRTATTSPPGGVRRWPSSRAVRWPNW
ncbi:putative hydrolase domain protein [Mycobacterium kansasii]|uniref:Putative hydrolase domain protein n=1 Tax=Mycobacterium kansasii TaxID=1768 RepID=A0A1V3WL22_MYCKA|nr:putative hydrolase domain protein [Mycobacterium kansasii]